MRTTLLALTLLACEAPPVFPTADVRQNRITGRIEGTVVASTAARGPVVVLLYDVNRPPPPQGTGRPVSFTVVPERTLFANGLPGAGPFVAPYTFSLVPPGRYLVRAFLDTNSDFNPFISVTSEANAGDVGGAAIDAVTRQPVILAVTESNLANLGTPVSVSDASRVPVDRPVFSVSGSTTLRLTAPRTTVELLSTPIDDGPVRQRAPVFLARFVDDDGDGRPDDANGDLVPDLWPRVVVRKLADGTANPLLDENDLDRNGIIDETGVDYEHVNPTNGQVIAPDGRPDVVVLAATVDPSELSSQLLDAMGRVKPMPTPVSRLKMTINLRAIDLSNPAAPTILRGVPSGRYAVTVIQQTGQTWKVPNELSAGLSERLGLPTITSQGFVIEVP